jgi:hypothetical protein
MVGPLGVVSGPLPTGGPVTPQNQAVLPSVVQAAAPPPPPPPPPAQVAPAPALPAPPTTAGSPAAATVVASAVDQAALVQADGVAGLGGNSVSVAPIDNTIQPDPSANSGDQAQT